MEKLLVVILSVGLFSKTLLLEAFAMDDLDTYFVKNLTIPVNELFAARGDKSLSQFIVASSELLRIRKEMNELSQEFENQASWRKTADYRFNVKRIRKMHGEIASLRYDEKKWVGIRNRNRKIANLGDTPQDFDRVRLEYCRIVPLFRKKNKSLCQGSGTEYGLPDDQTPTPPECGTTGNIPANPQRLLQAVEVINRLGEAKTEDEKKALAESASAEDELRSQLLRQSSQIPLPAAPHIDIDPVEYGRELLRGELGGPNDFDQLEIHFKDSPEALQQIYQSAFETGDRATSADFQDAVSGLIKGSVDPAMPRLLSIQQMAQVHRYPTDERRAVYKNAYHLAEKLYNEREKFYEPGPVKQVGSFLHALSMNYEDRESKASTDADRQELKKKHDDQLNEILGKKLYPTFRELLSQYREGKGLGSHVQEPKRNFSPKDVEEILKAFDLRKQDQALHKNSENFVEYDQMPQLQEFLGENEGKLILIQFGNRACSFCQKEEMEIRAVLKNTPQFASARIKLDLFDGDKNNSSQIHKRLEEFGVLNPDQVKAFPYYRFYRKNSKNQLELVEGYWNYFSMKDRNLREFVEKLNSEESKKKAFNEETIKQAILEKTKK